MKESYITTASNQWTQLPGTDIEIIFDFGTPQVRAIGYRRVNQRSSEALASCDDVYPETWPEQSAQTQPNKIEDPPRVKHPGKTYPADLLDLSTVQGTFKSTFYPQQEPYAEIIRTAKGETITERCSRCGYFEYFWQGLARATALAHVCGNHFVAAGYIVKANIITESRR